MNATISSGTLLAPVPTGLVLRSAVPTVDRILRESNPALVAGRLGGRHRQHGQRRQLEP